MKIIIIGTVASSLLGFRAPFIKMLVKKGHTVYAFSMDYTSEQKLNIIDVGAIPVDYSINRFGINPLSDIFNTIKLSRALRQINPDIVLSYFAKPVIFGTIAAWLAGVKNRVGMLEGLGYTFTDLPEGESFKKKAIKNIQVLLYRLSIPLLQRLIVLNPDDKKDLVDTYSIKTKKVSVLGGIGLELDQYPFIPVKESNDVNFTFIGRLLKEKGINQFLSAAEVVKGKYPNATFTILGGTEPDSSSSVTLTRLEQLCEMGVVQYPGQVPDIPDWLAKCSVFVLPSYREGVPRSTQEAMAIGRAIITTDVPGCRETIEHKRNGLLIPAHDVDALVEAMTYFVERPDKLSVMGLESHKIAVDKFDVNKVNEKLYRYLMDH